MQFCHRQMQGILEGSTGQMYALQLPEMQHNPLLAVVTTPHCVTIVICA